jgi:hypothetical protein
MHSLLRAFSFAAVAAMGAAVLAQSQEIRIGGTATTVTGAPGVAGGTQPMATGSGLVFGQVTEADSTRAVAGALVTLTLPGTQPLRVMADGQGRFGFRDLPAGNFSITTSRPGWSDGAYGRTRPQGMATLVTLKDGEKISGVAIPMWKFASIAGSVLDETGDPVVGMPVRVLRKTLASGKIRFDQAGQDRTDDRGMYRMGMLEPGDYLVVVPMLQSSGFDTVDVRGAVEREVMVMRTASAAASSGGNFIFVDGGGAPSAGMTEDGRPLAYPTLFYPNAPAAAKATVLSLGPGEERAAIDFNLKPVLTVKISGTAMGPEGPAANLQLTLTPSDGDELASSVEIMTGFTDGQGRFQIAGVPPGQYTLRATRLPRMAMGGDMVTMAQGGAVTMFRATSAAGAPPLPADATLWTEMALSVGGRDLEDINVGLRPGLKVSGQLQFNGGAERPTPDQLPAIGLMLEPADFRPGLSQGRGRVESSGSFSTVGVPAGRYFLRVMGAPRNWTFHSAMVNGRDASVTPVELDGGDVNGVVINFTDRPSELSGQVQMESGQLDAVTVLVFPAEQAAWTGYGSTARRFSGVRADKDGRFRIMNLPAGNYFLAAIPDKLASNWQDPKFLETLANEATRVTVRDADKISQNLKVIR